MPGSLVPETIVCGNDELVEMVILVLLKRVATVLRKLL